VVLDIAILNPEKTILTYRLASLSARVSAHLIDLVILVVVIIAGSLGAQFLSILQPGLATALALTLSALGPFVYFILFEGLWNGQTLGKRAVGIRVRMADGSPVTFGAALGRNLLRPADFLPSFYLVGLTAMFTNPKAQRLGDLVANTIVVNEKRNRNLMVAAPHTAGVHAFEASVGDLPGMTLEEYVALRRYCDRFPELPPDVQQHLTEIVWQPIAARRKVTEVPSVHPIYLAEAVVMKYGRKNGLL
jgi:uncharacterized RDD family membrane protein YckC